MIGRNMWEVIVYLLYLMLVLILLVLLLYIFRTYPDRPWGPPSLLYNGYRVFPGG